MPIVLDISVPHPAAEDAKGRKNYEILAIKVDAN